MRAFLHRNQEIIGIPKSRNVHFLDTFHVLGLHLPSRDDEDRDLVLSQWGGQCMHYTHQTEIQGT